MSDQTTIEELKKEVSSQKNQIRSLELAGKRAGAITAIIGLFSAFGGVVATLIFGVIVVNDEIRIWEKVKSAHLTGDDINPVYDHSHLMEPYLTDLVKYTDTIAICRNPQGCIFGSNKKSDELDLTLAKTRQYWTLERQ